MHHKVVGNHLLDNTAEHDHVQRPPARGGAACTDDMVATGELPAQLVFDPLPPIG